MSEMMVSLGVKGGERVWINPKEEVQDQSEDLAASVGSMSRSMKTIFFMAAGTMVMDAFFGGGTVALAAGGGEIEKAFQPIKDLLISIADPICYVMFVWGCIECIVGRAASGLNRMKYAAIGYIAINWIPVLMDVIRDAGAAGRGV